MRNLILTLLIFAITSLYTLFIDYFVGSDFALQRAITLPLLIILLIIYSISLLSWRGLLNNLGKWIILIIITIFVQLLIIATGNIKSPFFIFVHLFMIGISLTYSFSTSVLFLFATLVVLFGDIIFTQDIFNFILNDPYTIILQIFSFIPILSASYIISQHYHFKDKLFKTLHSQFITDETILANVEELIVITDSNYRILSVNDAVERAIQKSGSELINKPFFEIFFIKDNNGNLVNNKTFVPGDGEFLFVNSNLAQRRIHIRTQLIKDSEDNTNQFSFIISPVNIKKQKIDKSVISLSKAKAKYDAISEKIKQELPSNSLIDLRLKIILLEKIQNDIYMLQTLKENSRLNITRFDIAQLSRQISIREQDFASMYRIPVEFKIIDFDITDIAPLTVKNFHVEPDQLTGPFFTIAYDIQRVAMIVKKMLDISVFLASTEKNLFVLLTLQRIRKDQILLKITASCPLFSSKGLIDITTPYYGKLYNRTNLHIGSGLEGYLLKTLCEESNIPLEINYEEEKIIVSIILKRASEPYLMATGSSVALK